MVSRATIGSQRVVLLSLVPEDGEGEIKVEITNELIRRRDSKKRSSISMATNPSLLSEIGPDGLAREAPIIAYTEKILAEEQLQLKKYIEENYSKIRDIERELANLSFELKLTAGPKKAALEHMRKKIEISTEKIRLAKIKEEEARKMWEETSKAIKDEEAVKQKLCEDLNIMVQESSSTQFSRLEELKRRLEALNPSRASVSAIHDVNTMQAAESGITRPDVPSNSQTMETANRVADNASNPGQAPVLKGQNQRSSVEGEGRDKKKMFNPGRGRGVGILSKGRGGSGWTGSGFDVDGRN